MECRGVDSAGGRFSFPGLNMGGKKESEVNILSLHWHKHGEKESGCPRSPASHESIAQLESAYELRHWKSSKEFCRVIGRETSVK